MAEVLPPSPRHRIDSIHGWNEIGVELRRLDWAPNVDEPPGGFPPIRRKPNAKSNYNPAEWLVNVTTPVGAKYTKAQAQKKFLLTDFDLKDLVYTTRPAIRLPGKAYACAEAHLYLVIQLKLRAWEKYGGPTGLEEALKLKKGAGKRVQRGATGRPERNASEDAVMALPPPPAPASTPRRGDRNTPAQPLRVEPSPPDQGTPRNVEHDSPLGLLEGLDDTSSILTPLQRALSIRHHSPDLSTPTKEQTKTRRAPAPFPLSFIAAHDDDVISISDNSEGENVFKISFDQSKSSGGNGSSAASGTSSSSLSTPVKQERGQKIDSMSSTSSPQKRRKDVDSDDEVEIVSVTVTPVKKSHSISLTKRRKIASPDKKQACIDVIEISD